MESPGINSSLSKVFYFVFESIVLITEWLKAEEEPCKTLSSCQISEMRIMLSSIVKGLL